MVHAVAVASQAAAAQDLPRLHARDDVLNAGGAGGELLGEHCLSDYV
ncbi:hypothetical protein [Streptomyces venezuelae]